MIFLNSVTIDFKTFGTYDDNVQKGSTHKILLLTFTLVHQRFYAKQCAVSKRVSSAQFTIENEQGMWSYTTNVTGMWSLKPFIDDVKSLLKETFEASKDNIHIEG